MTRHELNEEYFDWMCSLIYDENHSKRHSYKKLLTYLNGIEFIYIIPQDGNRFEDGVDLRYRFGYERGFSDPIIASYLDDKPCSVLEMLVALSFRCEEHIMDDPEIGNRTGKWFWTMIDNLDLGRMNDSSFNSAEADRIINRFLNREYESDGTGGLFVIPDSHYDMRSVEIWYQLMWYLDNFF
jgi:hypothetical protein